MRDSLGTPPRSAILATEFIPGIPRRAALVGANAPLERESRSTEISELLHLYFAAADAVQEERLLASIVFDHALPVVRRTTRQRLRGTPAQDIDDVESDVTLQLVKRLKSLKQDPERETITDFPSYSAVAAHHGCDEYLRQVRPQRHRLKNRLRYLLAKDDSFALWHDSERGLVCGPALWRQRAVVSAQPGLAVKLSAAGSTPEAILRDLFVLTGSPLEFDSVVEVFAALFAIRDQTYARDIKEDSALSKEIAADDRIQQSQTLCALWNEIAELPLTQRAALLLNLRDANGGSALWFVASSAIASVRKIAELVDVPAEQFAQLWSRLPLSDLEIAQRLGVTRQQVINLRQAARQRLARKLRRST